MSLGKKKILSQGASGVTPTDNFAPITYTGNGTTQSISTLAFQPDLVWIKGRSGGTPLHNWLTDSVRGEHAVISSNLTNAEDTNTSYNVDSFDSNGFTLIGNSVGTNGSGVNYVAWNWKAGGAAVSNTDGTITSTVSANQDAGFSIVKYQANSTQGATIGHGLSSPPEMIITKEFTGVRVWCVYHKDLTSSGYYLELNTTNAELNSLGTAYAGVPNSSTYSVGNSSVTNNPSTDSYIAYCFHSVDGYQKIGSYTGTGAVNNQINVGFQPRFVMQKKTNGTGSWNIIDNQRGDDNYLSANLSNAEASMSASSFHLTSTGFTLDNSFSEWNASGGEYIYLAIK